MPRRAAGGEGGLVYHVLNRSVAGFRMFSEAGDYDAFEGILEEAHEREPMRILAYCIMPNHWHFVLWPEQAGQMARFIGWLTLVHAKRWHKWHGTQGRGHLYQGRYKSFPVASDRHLFIVCRYVERNPVRAGLVERPGEWRWASLWQRLHGGTGDRPMLSDWPVERSGDWTSYVNEPESEAEIEAVRNSVRRGTPFGAADWRGLVAARLGLENKLRPVGRPRKLFPE